MTHITTKGDSPEMLVLEFQNAIKSRGLNVGTQLNKSMLSRAPLAVTCQAAAGYALEWSKRQRDDFSLLRTTIRYLEEYFAGIESEWYHGATH